VKEARDLVRRAAIHHEAVAVKELLNRDHVFDHVPILLVSRASVDL
jgi:hypothetical protein